MEGNQAGYSSGICHPLIISHLHQAKKIYHLALHDILHTKYQQKDGGGCVAFGIDNQGSVGGEAELFLFFFLNGSVYVAGLNRNRTVWGYE